LGILVIVSLWLPNLVQAPTILLLREGSLILIQGNSLVGNDSGVFSNDLERQLWEAADKYSIDYDFFKAVINCECNLKKDHEECLGDKGLAFGRAQFHKPTFEANCLGDYRSERDQVFCAAEMISGGKGHNWSCWKKQVLADSK